MRKRKFKMRFVYKGKPPRFGTLYFIPTISVYLYMMGTSGDAPDGFLWQGPCYNLRICFLYWQVGFDLETYKLVQYGKR